MQATTEQRIDRDSFAREYVETYGPAAVLQAVADHLEAEGEMYRRESDFPGTTYLHERFAEAVGRLAAEMAPFSVPGAGIIDPAGGRTIPEIGPSTQSISTVSDSVLVPVRQNGA